MPRDNLAVLAEAIAGVVDRELALLMFGAQLAGCVAQCRPDLTELQVRAVVERMTGQLRDAVAVLDHASE